MLQQMLNTPVDLRSHLVQLYWKQMSDGQWRRFLDRLLRRRPTLEPLHAETAAGAGGRAYAGLHAVPLEAIRGTEEQAPAFDRTFHPHPNDDGMLEYNPAPG
jgi:hypothetical protein